MVAFVAEVREKSLMGLRVVQQILKKKNNTCLGKVQYSKYVSECEGFLVFYPILSPPAISSFSPDADDLRKENVFEAKNRAKG